MAGCNNTDVADMAYRPKIKPEEKKYGR